MELEQIIKNKKELEKQIAEIVAAFENANHITVGGFKIIRQEFPDNTSKIVDINSHVEIREY